MTVSPTDSPIAAARARADAELKKALSGLDPNDFSSSVPAFFAFIDSTKLLFNEEAPERLRTGTNFATFKRDLLGLRERIVDEYTKAPPRRKLTKRQRRRFERPLDIDKRLPVEPIDKWDLYAPTGLLPNKKHDIRKELRRVLGEQLSYWLREAASKFDRQRTSADDRPLLLAILKARGQEVGKMAELEFWRDIEARFRAIQSRKVPVHGVPWHDDSLYAVWLASGWSETGDQWRLDGADDTVKVNFKWLAERAAVVLGHLGGRSGVVFWLDLLKRDSPNYEGAGSGSGDKGLTRTEHGKIVRVCEASADYCLRLETQDRIRRASEMLSPVSKNDRTLTEAQLLRINDAERELKDNLAAHEKMRELLEPGEWRQVGVTSQERRMAGEIPKLQRDIEDCVIKVLRVLAEASLSLGSVKLFSDQLQGDARELLEWAFSRVNPKDLSVLDKHAIETALAEEISDWIHKAQREFSPPWKTNSAANELLTVTAYHPQLVDPAEQPQPDRAPESAPMDSPSARPQTSALKPEGPAKRTEETVLPATEQDQRATRAAARQAVVMPILKSRRWKRGKWATQAGVGKNSVYEYLDGRRTLSDENRRAMAEVLELNPLDLPD